MNRLILLLVAIFATSAVAEFTTQAFEMKLLWSTWKNLNNKVYTQSEDLTRFGTFVQNYFTIVSHNRQNSKVRLALNQFADLTDEEFKNQFTTGLKRRTRDQVESQAENWIDYSVLALPKYVDWRLSGVVNRVKNQKNCGSCWAFSAAGALESLNAIKTGKLISFSEQNLVDCEKKDNGCDGGEMSHAFEYVAENGIQLEDDYPYTAKDGECKFDAQKAHRINTGYRNVTANNTDALKAAIAVQPVSVAVRADQPAFRFYSRGVLDGDAGCDNDLNHGILAVGYGLFDGEEAFIVKNSWNYTWGDNGYIHISTNQKANGGSGVCGILIDNSYPTV